MSGKSAPGAKELQLRAMREQEIHRQRTSVGSRSVPKRKPPPAAAPAVKPSAPRPSAGGAAAKAKKRQHA